MFKPNLPLVIFCQLKLLIIEKGRLISTTLIIYLSISLSSTNFLFFCCYHPGCWPHSPIIPFLFKETTGRRSFHASAPARPACAPRVRAAGTELRTCWDPTRHPPLASRGQSLGTQAPGSAAHLPLLVPPPVLVLPPACSPWEVCVHCVRRQGFQAFS